VETPLSTITRLQENKRKGRTTPKQKTTHLTNPKHNTKRETARYKTAANPINTRRSHPHTKAAPQAKATKTNLLKQQQQKISPIIKLFIIAKIVVCHSSV
jgi:hypothetical protein